MAMVARALCDVCGTERDVQTVTVVYGKRTPSSALNFQQGLVLFKVVR